ncbi:MAG: 1-deoxy-D-xylulose-5-phosphate synthase [Clostridiales bacterium]|uniref:1-deoxy-D-xylulose-5-phosphate synthase n=1 Tax=Clostridium sp. N3C TaxID=1776758 RepID=UPI00092E0566|nr:1-deoxy-D-xylulose-5-phosphate synthase [Clostridium sp. N3C]NLZ47373.1 1-deoxy-D-xylulose-5-phosphate synthase [Clostridiales bacterium]SCN21386.1 1-deoxy-D-xylulose-5-phosphate synthase [Clostridium sp. N3C]
MYKILGKFHEPTAIQKMTLGELEILSKEIRSFLIEKVSKNGGHLASNLGVVELTISLYNVFDFKKDRLIWDVGHQSYVHKVLTGRMEAFDTLRQYGGLSGFPKPQESPYDMFITGHSSTSISAALGMARVRDLKKEDYCIVAVIGDGALTGGMAMEALNDVGDRKTKIIIVLNDNQMSIAKNVGGISTYLSQLRIGPSYTKFKNEFNSTMLKSPLGKGVVNSINKIKDSIKQFVVPGMLFEEMGLTYLGPIDGHNIKELSKVLALAKNTDGPVIIHTITQKGKGYDFAEKNPNKFHGVGPFDCDSGEICFTGGNTYSKVFGDELVKIAEKNHKVIAITAAMKDGTGLGEFAKKFKDRFFDVGIAEQHAVTLAAGMAKDGAKPVFAVYSTFLQRAYDQVVHDVCIGNLPVILAVDRAGIVGEDGETHQGIFDLSYLCHIPNMTVLAPKCTKELRSMLRWAVDYNGPIAIRYPRGGDLQDLELEAVEKIELGKWEVLKSGGDIAILAVGKMVSHAILAARILEEEGIAVSVINAYSVKPLDFNLLDDLCKKGYKIVTVEDNVINGGFGSLVLNYIFSKNNNIEVLNLGYKDEFIQQGNPDLLYSLLGLDPKGIAKSILARFKKGVKDEQY